MRNLIRLIGRFRSDRRGNIAVIFTLALLPILSAVGSAIDYTVATRMKAKLQSAADAASIASISQNSPGFMAASVMTSDGSVAVAVNMNCRRVDAIDALIDARVVCRWVYICSFALPQSFD